MAIADRRIRPSISIPGRPGSLTRTRSKTPAISEKQRRFNGTLSGVKRSHGAIKCRLGPIGMPLSGSTSRPFYLWSYLGSSSSIFIASPILLFQGETRLRPSQTRAPQPTAGAAVR
jgi:hypothetical protein